MREPFDFSGVHTRAALTTETTLCACCGCAIDRHEIEPPYPCYDCDCLSFEHAAARLPKEARHA